MTEGWKMYMPPCVCGATPIWEDTVGSSVHEGELVYRILCENCGKGTPWWSSKEDCFEQWPPKAERANRLSTAIIKAQGQSAPPSVPVNMAGITNIELLNFLEQEIEAIDPIYRGSPTFSHDAHWMKERVRDVFAKAKGLAI